MQFSVNPVQKQGNIKWKLHQRMEHCNWLIKKRNTEEPNRCSNLYWPLKVARKTGSVLCRIALWDCLEANFHSVNFLSWILLKNNNTSCLPQFGIDLLVISRGFWKLLGFHLYVIAPILFVIAVSVVSSALSLLYACICIYYYNYLFFLDLVL